MNYQWDPFKDKQCMAEYCELNSIDFDYFLEDYAKEEVTDSNRAHYEQWYCENNTVDFLEFSDRYLEEYLDAQDEQERVNDR